MLTNACQRSDPDGNPVYVPAREVIDPRHFEVAEVREMVAKAFVERFHYAKSYPAARFRFGLFQRGGELVGVAVFSHPMQDKVLKALPCDREEGVELGRLVLLDHVLANAESWFIARCFELLYRAGVRGVVSFSDPEPRTDTSGRTVFRGHVGFIYQASNACYAGRATARTLRLLPNGLVLSDRAISKVRQQERGHEYAEALLVQHGARPRRPSEDPRLWLASELPRITRPIRHHGNFKYLFGLDRRVRKRLPASLPYPKLTLPREVVVA